MRTLTVLILVAAIANVASAAITTGIPGDRGEEAYHEDH